MSDFYDKLNLPVRFEIDLEKLENEYERALYLNATDEEINVAYITLKDDVKRAEYLLREAQYDIPDKVVQELFEVVNGEEYYLAAKQQFSIAFDEQRNLQEAFIALYKMKFARHMMH